LDHNHREEVEIVKQKRRLKVYETGDPHRGGILPQIRLQGKWLRQAGFAPGGQVEVQVETGRLIIKSEERYHEHSA
jgi:hypothetical protein